MSNPLYQTAYRYFSAHIPDERTAMVMTELGGAPTRLLEWIKRQPDDAPRAARISRVIPWLVRGFAAIEDVGANPVTELAFKQEAHAFVEAARTVTNDRALRQLWQEHNGTLLNSFLFSLGGGEVAITRAAERKAIHMVTAWVYENHAAFGQVKVDDKSNEITAIPELLKLLNLHGATVTIDAMGCQKDIAEQIVTGGGDYVLALKGNQGTLHDEVREFFEDALDRGFDATLDTHKTVEKNHGRIEERQVWLSTDIDWLRDTREWKGLGGIVAVQSKRTIDGESTTERRHYICSGKRTARDLGHLIRRHWSVENELHWALDVGFREDLCRVRVQNAAENLARFRRVALSILKQDTTTKAGMHGKRLKAAWDRNYLLRLLRF